MPNAHVLQRLEGIQSIFMGVHQAGSSLSASSKGNERQAFIDRFLGDVLPPVYRFGTGDATDTSGNAVANWMLWSNTQSLPRYRWPASARPDYTLLIRLLQ